jgi:hypothetical protein
MLNIEPDDGTPTPPIDEGQSGYVIQVGPRLYGDAENMFVTDDDAFAYASAHFADFSIRPVLKT